MVYAVAVQQPVQSWTVLRSHDEFCAVGHALARAGVVGPPDLPPCPPHRNIAMVEGGGASDSQQSALVTSRNELQHWLSTVLMHPAARESGTIREFLTSNANLILPQYEGVVAWTQFGTALPAATTTATAPAAASAVVPPPAPTTPTTHHHHQHPNHPSTGQVDDMEMDDMFLADDDGVLGGGGHDDPDDCFDEDAVPPAASVRYKPCDEQVTDEDELAILAGDVEMVEDVGSLAQSLGASHLGRSLQLQAELKQHRATAGAGAGGNHHRLPAQPSGVQGLTIGKGGGTVATPLQQQPLTGAGGIGGAISMAAANGGTVGGFGAEPFNRRPLESAPRLDSFRMLRVIGKGSFGTKPAACDMGM